MKICCEFAVQYIAKDNHFAKEKEETNKIYEKAYCAAYRRDKEEL